MNKQYYKDKYLQALDRIEAELKAEGVDVSDGTAISYEFDETANADEVVGFYLVNEGDNAYRQWRFNIDGIDLSEQDKRVTEILRDLSDLSDGYVTEKVWESLEKLYADLESFIELVDLEYTEDDEYVCHNREEVDEKWCDDEMLESIENAYQDLGYFLRKR